MKHRKDVQGRLDRYAEAFALANGYVPAMVDHADGAYQIMPRDDFPFGPVRMRAAEIDLMTRNLEERARGHA